MLPICNLQKIGAPSSFVSIHPETGAVDEESIQNALNASERIKAIILIDPNNPTGFPIETEVLERIADIAEKHNSLILTDEVYASFSLERVALCKLNEPKTNNSFDAISKIERSTGVRLGSLYLAPEAREFIAREILEPECPGFMKNIPICDGFFFS